MPFLLPTHALIVVAAGVVANAELPAASDDTANAAPTAPSVTFLLLDTALPFRMYRFLGGCQPTSARHLAIRPPPRFGAAKYSLSCQFCECRHLGRKMYVFGRRLHIILSKDVCLFVKGWRPLCQGIYTFASRLWVFVKRCEFWSEKSLLCMFSQTNQPASPPAYLQPQSTAEVSVSGR